MASPAFSELDALHALIEAGGPLLRSDVVASVAAGEQMLPVWCLEAGSRDLRAPAIGFFAGVHGMERIGTQVLLAWLQTLLALFNATYPNHSFYLMEPQSLSYTTHGDLWDFLYDEHQHKHPQGFFLPFTLEMGSWLWVKKNPRQLFSWFGHFNPVLPHRLERVLRRHLTLFDFLLQATASHRRWLPRDPLRAQYHDAALARWFADARGKDAASGGG